MSIPPKRPPALLFLGNYYGTLATARELGRRGVEVVLADSEGGIVRAQASRFVKRRLRCPEISNVPAFVRWLVELGRSEPGFVLDAANDELVWIFAKHHDELAPWFELPPTSLTTALALLDKKRLHDACARAGVATPRTWYPRGEDEARAIAASLPRPVLLKPRTQIQLTSLSKGARVGAGDDFVARYLDFAKANSFGAALVEGDPEIVWPMAQEFLEGATHDIYSLAGFTDGDRIVARASVKILQRPRNLGVGLCFESAPVDAEIVASIARLCREVGYRGVFEVELVEGEVLIDFNPRPYGQMAFEMARGLPLAWLSYLLASHDEAALALEIERAGAWSDPRKYVYAHGLLLGLVATGQLVARTLRGTPDERWLEWKGRGARYVDAVRDADDPWPSLVDVAEQAQAFVKHPRSFLRSLSR